MSLSLSQTVKTLTFKGWVADFCPICRSLQPFLVRTSHLSEEEVHLVGFLPLAHSRDLGITGHDRVCDTCGFCTPTSPTAFAEVLPDRPPDFAILLRRTNPEAPLRCEGRLRIEEDLAQGRLAPGARATLLVEAIDCLDPHLRRVLPSPLRRWHWMLPLGLLLGSVGLASALEQGAGVRLGSVSGLLALTTVSSLLGFLGAGIRAWLRPAFVRRALVLEAFPLLARAWSPLNPTRQEVEGAVAKALESGSAWAKDLDVERLLLELPDLTGA